MRAILWKQKEFLKPLSKIVCTLLWQWGEGPILLIRSAYTFDPYFVKSQSVDTHVSISKVNFYRKLLFRLSQWCSHMRLVSAPNFTVICHYRMILCTIQAIVPWNTMPATLNKSIFKTRSHVLFGLGTISHSRSLLQYLFLLYYESLEEAGCKIVAEKLPSNDNPKKFIFIYIKTFASNQSTYISI